MKILILNVLILFSVCNVLSQKMHTPPELMKMMEESNISYTLSIIAEDSTLECKDYSQKVNNYEFYRKEVDNKIITLEYKYDKVESELLEKAEHAYRYKELDSALYYYEKVLKINPKLYKVITYIGQVHSLKKDYSSAIEWYKRSIDSNYIDYLAHWFLAEAYFLTNDFEKAKDEITIAHILNRNHYKILKTLELFLEKTDQKYINWCFDPQYKLKRESDSVVLINSPAKWLGYATIKAFWQYEPDYKKSMVGTGNSLSTVEEMECLLPIIVLMESNKEDFKGDLQFDALYEAFQNKSLKEYILYEIILPPIPFVAYQLSKEQIFIIKDYVLKTRIKKI